MRGRHRHPGHLGRHDLRGSLLVGGVAIREQEDDRHRLDAGGQQLAGGRPHGLFVERHQHLARRAQALRHLARAAARHQWLGTPIEHVVHLQEVAAADLEDVAKSRGGDEAGARPLQLEERVDPDRGPVDDEPAVRQPDAGLVDAGEDALEELAGGAQSLGGDDGARGLVERDEVREGAADVDADSQSHVTPYQASAGAREVASPRGPRAPSRPTLRAEIFLL